MIGVFRKISWDITRTRVTPGKVGEFTYVIGGELGELLAILELPLGDPPAMMSNPSAHM